jgi:hypothetical protein
MTSMARLCFSQPDGATLPADSAQLLELCPDCVTVCENQFLMCASIIIKISMRRSWAGPEDHRWYTERKCQAEMLLPIYTQYKFTQPFLCVKSNNPHHNCIYDISTGFLLVGIAFFSVRSTINIFYASSYLF